MKFSKQFKKSFSYTWYLYLLALVIPSLLFTFSFSFMHRPKEYEILSLFLSCNLTENAEDKFYEEVKDFNIKKAELVNADPYNTEVGFDQKLSVVGYNRCDLIVLPLEECDSVGIFTVALEFDEEIKNFCKIEGENLYTFDGKTCGVELSHDSPLMKFGDFKKDINYYAFLNAKSYNIGDYSLHNPHTDNAFKLMQYALGK